MSAGPGIQLPVAALDRAAGALVGQACGDALGVPYEFQPRLRGDERPVMRGGGLGPYAPGEYSDDTQMAVCVAEVAATGRPLTETASLDAIAERFERWLAGGATDVGNQTRAVLDDARRRTGSPATRLRDAAAALHRRTGHTAGNGALMRTAAVALAHLGDDASLAEAARAVAELTHADPLAGDSCVLWCAAIDRAVREARLDGLEEGVSLLPAERRDRWAAWLAEASQGPPARFTPNGFTVTALQAAWSAIAATPVPPDAPGSGEFPCRQLEAALVAAIRVGDDTDTVAAIAGALLGARWGLSGIPAAWRRPLHGWPGLRGRDLARLGILAARGGSDDSQGWPSCRVLDYGVAARAPVPHPRDEGILLGTARWVESPDITAIISLCRLGTAEVPAAGVAPEDHVEFWLIDSPERADNPNLAHVIDDAARTAAALRDEGHRLLIHCVRAESRTPLVAAGYSVVARGADAGVALEEIAHALGGRLVNPGFTRELRRLS